MTVETNKDILIESNVKRAGFLLEITGFALII